MRNPNGYGGVSRLPGNRRRPYRARVTVGWEEKEDGGRLQRYATIGFFESRTQAMIALAEYNQKPYDVTQRKTTFRQAYTCWSRDHFAKYPSTRRVNEAAMEYCRPIWNIPLHQIRTSQLQGIIDGMKESSRGYQSKIRGLIRMVFRWAVAKEILDKDRSAFLELTAPERESPRRVFTSEEIGTLWELYNSRRPAPGEALRFNGVPMLGSLLLLLYTGMRVGELLSLRREDVCILGRYIDLRGTKTRAARRRIPLHRDIIPVLESMCRSGTGEYLISLPEGAKMSYSMYKYGWFDKVMAALSMSHTPHDTRHTFVSALDSAGVRRGALKFIVGHSQTDVTDRYTHKDLPELLREIDKLSFENDPN